LARSLRPILEPFQALAQVCDFPLEMCHSRRKGAHLRAQLKFSVSARARDLKFSQPFLDIAVDAVLPVRIKTDQAFENAFCKATEGPVTRAQRLGFWVS
jgi:hypothetical protein